MIVKHFARQFWQLTVTGDAMTKNDAKKVRTVDNIFGDLQESMDRLIAAKSIPEVNSARDQIKQHIKELGELLQPKLKSHVSHTSRIVDERDSKSTQRKGPGS